MIICRYLQSNKDDAWVFIPSNKMVVGCYFYANFLGIWVDNNLQYPICSKSRNLYVVTFSNIPIF